MFFASAKNDFGFQISDFGFVFRFIPTQNLYVIFSEKFTGKFLLFSLLPFDKLNQFSKPRDL